MIGNLRKISFLKNYTGGIFFFMLLFYSPCLWAEVAKDTVKDEKKNNVYNLYDMALGKVTEDGIIFNKFGRSIGSVDEKGIIYNISNITIGKVENDGTVLNQSGTMMGSVNEKGEIFSVSDRKMGSVKDVENIKLVGGAARLLLFKTYSRR